MSMEKDFDVMVIGCGLVGASLVAALRDTGLHIALITSEPLPDMPAAKNSAEQGGWGERVYAISPVNADFLAEIGVWAHLAQERVNRVGFMEIREGDARMGFDAHGSGLPALAWILEESLMMNELSERLKRQTNVTIFSPATPVDMAKEEGDGGGGLATLTLQDGRRLRGRLVIGADGRDSWTRQQAGLVAREKDYRAECVVANFSCAKPHRNTAWQWFQADGVLAWLPLPGNRFSMAWSVSPEKAAGLLALSPEELARTVASAGGNALGDLTTITSAAAFPLRMISVPVTVAPRLALIGDAAHGIHPLSGHGVNLGFQDARALAKLLGNAIPGQDIGEAGFLARYQRERREETVVTQRMTDALACLFSARLPGLPRLRALGLTLTHRLPPLKNLLARYAAGVYAAD